MVGPLGAFIGALGSIAWIYTAIESFGAGLFWFFLVACVGLYLMIKLTAELIKEEL